LKLMAVQLKFSKFNEVMNTYNQMMKENADIIRVPTIMYILRNLSKHQDTANFAIQIRDAYPHRIDDAEVCASLVMAEAKCKRGVQYLQMRYREHLTTNHGVPTSFAINWYLCGLREMNELDKLFNAFFDATTKYKNSLNVNTFKNIVFINPNEKYTEMQGRGLQILAAKYGQIDASWVSYFLNCCYTTKNFELALTYYDRLKKNIRFSIRTISLLMRIYRSHLIAEPSKTLEITSAVSTLHDDVIKNIKFDEDSKLVHLDTYNYHTNKLFDNLGLPYTPIFIYK